MSRLHQVLIDAYEVAGVPRIKAVVLAAQEAKRAPQNWADWGGCYAITQENGDVHVCWWRDATVAPEEP